MKKWVYAAALLKKMMKLWLSCTPEAPNLALNLKLLCNMSSKLRVLPGVNPKGWQLGAI